MIKKAVSAGKQIYSESSPHADFRKLCQGPIIPIYL